MTRLVIVGAGGHGAVVAEAAISSGEWSSIGFLDDMIESNEVVVECPVIGETALWPDLINKDCHFFVAVGDNQKRDEILSQIEERDGMLAMISHSAAVISPSSSIEAATFIAAGAIIGARATIGRGAIVNTGASIDHDCVVGRAVHISPGAHVAGNVTIGCKSWIGVGASVREEICIGRNTRVGAGAAVVSDVDDNVTVIGVPAVQMGAK